MKKTLIAKFGGASLQSIEAFQNVVHIISRKQADFQKIVVIVSAMWKMTDSLLNLASQVSLQPPGREQDMLLSVGERISMSLLAMVFAEKGIGALSFTGSQAGVITSDRHTDARILDVRPRRLIPQLDMGNIVVVAGFQGVSQAGEITTLGRGGSDTTAVALGVALRADKVEFYKDVDGIFSDDPKVRPDAQKLPLLGYQEAINIVARSKVKVVHPRALELAKQNHLPLHILSYNGAGDGSMIVSDKRGLRDTPVYEPEESLV